MPTNSDDQLLDDAYGPLNPSWVPDVTTATARFIETPVTELYADPLYGKLRAVRVDQGTNLRVRMPLFSPSGGPVTVNVGPYSSPPTIGVRFREATGFDPRVYEPDDASLLADDGKSINFSLPAEVVDSPGVYRAQTRVADADGNEVVRDEVTVYLERGLWTLAGDAPGADVGPPTVLEVRTMMRDHPAANRLLGDYEFDVAEIAQAATSAVRNFGTAFPPLPAVPTTRTFPAGWRQQWLEGIAGYLFETMASYCRRGTLPYTAGGLTINDLAKENEYLRASQLYRQRFDSWAKTVRTKLSIDAGWGSLTSGLVNGWVAYRGRF